MLWVFLLPYVSYVWETQNNTESSTVEQKGCIKYNKTTQVSAATVLQQQLNSFIRHFILTSTHVEARHILGTSNTNIL